MGIHNGFAVLAPKWLTSSLPEIDLTRYTNSTYVSTPFTDSFWASIKCFGMPSQFRLIVGFLWRLQVSFARPWLCSRAILLP